jgi:hypothetical protein
VDGKLSNDLTSKYTIVGRKDYFYIVNTYDLFTFEIVIIIIISIGIFTIHTTTISDHEYDAVVVGAGGAGLRAAMGLAEAG